MGQKVHPIGIRVGFTKPWSSVWYESSNKFADMLCADIKVRKYIKKKLAPAGINRVEIERPAKNANITIYAARPGMIYGKKGGEVDSLRDDISKIMGVSVNVNIKEVRKPELEATLVAETIAQQLEKRVMFRRAMKRAVASAQRAGALGVKICCSGRLGGAEIARSEWIREGRVPLHTLRADIDYGVARAETTYGVIGVKVWIYKGDATVESEQLAAQNEKASG